MHEKIKELVIHLGSALQQHHWSCATAESCTGGGLAYAITSFPGSSAWFDRGFITYSNQSKQDLLGVTSDTLSLHGSVSEAVAIEMAQGALKHSMAQLAISITGIAGPSGGSVDKPVGTVWIGLAAINSPTTAMTYYFHGDREQIREQTIITALEQLIQRASSNHF